MPISNISNNKQSKKKSTNAWLIQYGESDFVVLPLLSCQEVVESPQVLDVPAINDFAYGLVHWRNQWIPIIELSSLLSGKNKNAVSAFCLIVAYHDNIGDMKYVALSISYMPHTINVSDDSICGLPSDGKWDLFAPSCIIYQTFRVPIIDTNKLFTLAHTK